MEKERIPPAMDPGVGPKAIVRRMTSGFFLADRSRVDGFSRMNGRDASRQPAAP
jgi:hypothetical protein